MKVARVGREFDPESTWVTVTDSAACLPYCREMAALPERRMYFCTLPVAVLGS